MDSREEILACKLQARVALLLSGALCYSGAIDVVRKIAIAAHWQAYVFGGCLRHLLSDSWREAPRDVDVVVAGVDGDVLERAFESCLERKNRFGGLQVQIDGTKFDIWSLRDTWAFSQREFVDVTFESLPRTTFLNLEAVVVDLMPEPGEFRKVHSHGFFEAIGTKVLEMNFEANPFPDACVVRALAVSSREGMGLGPRLTRFVAEHGPAVSTSAVTQIQQSHFGRVIEPANRMRARIREIRDS